MIRRGLTVVACALLAGCTGNIGALEGKSDGPGNPTGSGGSDPGSSSGTGAAGSGPSTPGSTGGAPTDPGSPPAALKCEPGAVDPGPAPLRLLSRAQYLNTVRDLLGDVPGIDAAIGSRRDPSEFGLVQADVAPVDVENYQAAANLVASTVVGNAQRLNALVPCADGTGKRECVKTFVSAFGAKAYRAPLTDGADIDRHLALYDAGASQSHTHGVEMLLRGMLQSTRFLYRVELGTGTKVSSAAIKLSAHELAARLSYTAWDSVPDAELVRAAEAGQLDTPAGVVTQLTRLITAEKGRRLVGRFLERLVHLADVTSAVKDDALYPEWKTTSLRNAVGAQATRFFDFIVEERGGSVTDLLTSPTVFANGDLVAYYPGASGRAFAATRTDGTASGLLTLPAFLALKAKPGESSPIYRGKFVRESLLCQTLPSPPNNIPKPPEVTAGVSTRERLRQHETDPVCANCHKLMDPIGFGFEHYDAIGRYRTEDGKQPVDSSGELVQTDDIDGAFDGVVELGERLASSAEVEECVARQWFRFTMNRFERDVDACSMKAVVDAFRAKDGSLNALPEAIVKTDAFLYRRPPGAEDSP